MNQWFNKEKDLLIGQKLSSESACDGCNLRDRCAECFNNECETLEAMGFSPVSNNRTCVSASL